MYRIAIFVLAALMCAATSAQARWKAEYASQPQEVRDWYEQAELTPAAKARLHFQKCCASSEVVRTKFRVNKSSGQDEWEWLDKDTWRVVPPDIIHVDEYAPDGQPTLFVLPGSNIPTCFYPGRGGL